MSADEETAYKQAAKEFDELRDILPKFAQKRAWLRPADDVSHRIQRSLPPGTVASRGAVRDSAVCALTNKGCNTHAAVRMLTDAGNGDDAMVLTRVVMETTVLLQWILRDRIYRLDLYCLSSALFKRHWIELVREYFSGEPDVVAMAERSLDASDAALVQAAFGNTEYRWARERKEDGRFEDYNVEKMIKEIAAGDGSKPPSHFLYDVIYHMHSAHAHGTVEGMQQFRTLARQKTFTCELGCNDGQSTIALQGANTYLAWLLQGACNYLGFDDIDREIDEWFERMTAAAKGARRQAGASDSVTGHRPRG